MCQKRICSICETKSGSGRRRGKIPYEELLTLHSVHSIICVTILRRQRLGKHVEGMRDHEDVQNFD
jgi:hypothetical protein